MTIGETALDQTVENVERMRPLQNMATETSTEQDSSFEDAGSQEAADKKITENKRQEEIYDNVEILTNTESMENNKLPAVTEELKKRPSETEQELLFTNTRLEKVGEGMISENKREEDNDDSDEIHTDAESVEHEVTEELKKLPESRETEQEKDRVEQKTGNVGGRVVLQVTPSSQCSLISFQNTPFLENRK